MPGQPRRRRPQSLHLGRVRRRQGFLEAPGAEVLSLQVADHRQIQEQQRVATRLRRTAQAAGELRADGGASAAVHQDVEDGRQPVPVQAAHEPVPPHGQNRRDLPIPTQDMQLERQGGKQLDHLGGVERVDDGCPAGEHRRHLVFHLGANVPDAAVLPQVMEQEREDPQRIGGSEVLQVRGDYGFDVPASRSVGRCARGAGCEATTVSESPPPDTRSSRSRFTCTT